MIRSYTAYTNEMDDIQLAVSEIVEQLAPEKNCLKSTVAVVTCYHEFATNGIIAELYKKLQFPIIGTTTISLATNRGFGQLDMGITMITSDDVTFSAACSSSLVNELEAPLTEMYQSALKGHTEKPKLILSAAPLLLHHAGDHYVNILNKVSGGVPNFGTLAIDDSANYENSYVIFNDRVEKDMYGVIVASGNLNPQFLYASVSPEKIFTHSAVITKSEGNLLKEVNGLSLYDYLETWGMASNGKVKEGLNSIPLMLDYTSGAKPVSKVLIYVNEEGYGVCGGLMPEGATMSIGAWDREDVVNTCVQTVKRILQDGNVNVLFVYSCLGRNFALGADIMAEVEQANAEVANRVPYMFAYAGGEICPIRNVEDSNRFHNNTVIACAF